MLVPSLRLHSEGSLPSPRAAIDHRSPEVFVDVPAAFTKPASRSQRVIIVMKAGSSAASTLAARWPSAARHVRLSAQPSKHKEHYCERFEADYGASCVLSSHRT